MNDVPLIQSPDTNSINTSIIAIKKQLRTINEALGLIDIPDAPDLSPYVKKSDVVDTVESGNMNPVTSNAVASALVGKADFNAGIWQATFTPRQVNDPTWLANFVHSVFDVYGVGLILFSVDWNEYQSFPFAGAQGYIMRGLSSAAAFGMMRNYDEGRWTYSTKGINADFTSLSWTWISDV